MVKKTNPFLEFLQQDRFYNIIYKRIFGFFKGNKELIQARLNDSINYITEIQDIDLDFINVWIDNKDGSRIDFDIAISVDLSVTARYGKYRDIDEFYANNIWITIYCTGDIEKKLSDLKIIGIEEFNKSKPKKPLSGHMVPIISSNEYNKYANDILEKYYPDVLKSPMNVDVDELAKRMGLKVINHSITEDGSLFGQIFFKDTKVKLYDRKTKSMKKYRVAANTIIVDKKVSYLYSFGSRNMTVAHECIHYELHKKAFYFAQMFDDDLKYIQCQVKGRLENSDTQSSTYWMELQANAIAPYILMPDKTFKAKVEELYKSYGYFQERDSIDFIQSIIRELAEFFGVTVYAARKRMIDLGYEVAIGAYNWVDGNYVRPYRFKKGSLKSDETYTISYRDVLDVLFQDSSIVEGLIFKNYVFVENHICINNDKYITKDLFGKLVLTEYARRHMDECCLKFKIKTIGFAQSSSITTFCYLGRDCRQNFEFELSLPEDENNEVITKGKYKENMDSYLEGINEMRKISGMSVAEAIKFLMDYFDIRTKELEFDSGLDERTIRRYANGENKEPNKRTLIAICRGMKLPFTISELLLSRAGITLIPGDRDDEAYKAILIGMLKQTPEEVNEFLTNSGCTPIISEKL